MAIITVQHMGYAKIQSVDTLISKNTLFEFSNNLFGEFFQNRHGLNMLYFIVFLEL